MAGTITRRDRLVMVEPPTSSHPPKEPDRAIEGESPEPPTRSRKDRIFHTLRQLGEEPLHGRGMLGSGILGLALGLALQLTGLLYRVPERAAILFLGLSVAWTGMWLTLYLVQRARKATRPAFGQLLKITAILCGVVVLAGLLVLGSTWATANGGGALVAGLVILLGLAMIVPSPRQRRMHWLAIPALLLAVPAIAGIDIRGGAGSRSFTPIAIARLPHQYRLGAGQLVLDLRRLDLHGAAWPREGPVTLDVHVGIGRVVVLMPWQTPCTDEVPVYVDSHVVGHFSGPFEPESTPHEAKSTQQRDRHGGSREVPLDRPPDKRLQVNVHVDVGILQLWGYRRLDRKPSDRPATTVCSGARA